MEILGGSRPEGGQKMHKITNLLSIIPVLFCVTGCGNVRYETVPPESKQMKYLLFPSKSSRSTLNRAILVSGEELYAGKKIAYYAGNNEVWCDKVNFTLLPDSQQDTLVQHLNDELVRWGKETDYRRIEYSREKDHILLTIVFKSGRKAYFRYKIAGTHTVSSAENGMDSI